MRKSVNYLFSALLQILSLITAVADFSVRPCYIHSANTISSGAILEIIYRMRGGDDITGNEKKGKQSVENARDHLRKHIGRSQNIAFSDVDGTLVHYPDTDELYHENEPGNKMIYLPASSTGMRGVISSKTLQLCQTLRRNESTKLVLVSGMRTSTLIKRLPYLPRADAYASEGGGRIFYPVPKGTTSNSNMVHPVEFDGASDDDMKPFGLVEDELWRSKLSEEYAAGTDGFVGDSMDIYLGKQRKDTPMMPINERKGALWDFARTLQDTYVIDYKGYSNCFRVNKKQQKGVSEEDFNKLQSLDVSGRGLASSVNLGCVDFYPNFSGKRNCCEYLARRFMDISEIDDDEILNSCICLCDDDNDLDMAAGCGKVFLPSVTSESMARTANASPEKFIVTENKPESISETKATEEALLGTIKEFQNRKKENNEDS